jgi:hypothetical protein
MTGSGGGGGCSADVATKWTELLDFPNAGYGGTMYWSRFQSGDSTSPSFTLVSTDWWWWVAIAFDKDTADPRGTYGTGSDTMYAFGTSSKNNPPSKTGNDGTRDYLAVAIAAGDGAAGTVPTGYTSQVTKASGWGPEAKVATKALAAATTEDPGTFGTNCANWAAFTVLLHTCAGEITLRSVTQGYSNCTASTNVNITMPISKAGDVLVVTLGLPVFNAHSYTPPAGWTEMKDTAGHALYYKQITADKGRGTTETWVIDSLEYSYYPQWTVAAYSSAYGGVSYTAANGSSSAGNPPSHTAPENVTSKGLWVACQASCGGSGAPSGYTADRDYGGYCSSSKQGAAAATEDPGAYAGTPTRWSCATLALVPAAAGGGWGVDI